MHNNVWPYQPYAIIILNHWAGVYASLDQCRSNVTKNGFLILLCFAVADLQFVSQMTHYWLVGRDIYQGRPNTERWVKACQEYLAPHFDSVYQAVYHHRKAGTFSAQSQLDL